MAKTLLITVLALGGSALLWRAGVKMYMDKVVKPGLARSESNGIDTTKWKRVETPNFTTTDFSNLSANFNVQRPRSR